MVFDFNGPISGYGLLGLQISRGRLGETIKVENRMTGNRFAIGGWWRSAKQARTADLKARQHMGLMLQWVSSIARWNI
jgi:hypothetical protein